MRCRACGRRWCSGSESVKTTQTTIPFIKDNEFDYGWLTGGNGTATWLLYVLVAIFVVTAVSNGANLTDGLDGLATGVSVPIVAVLGVLAYLSGHIVYADYLNIMYIPQSGELVVFAAALVGALVGFLWYNSFPAQIFMGDTGSLSIGGVIAVFALCIRKELLLPLLCGVFLVESFSVMMQVGWFKYTRRRYGEGRRILLMSPVHHHYQKRGIFETKIVTRFWIISLLLAAITLVTLEDTISDRAVRRGRRALPGRPENKERNHAEEIHVVVLGGGISGYGSAILAKKKGFGVFLSDSGRIADRYRERLDEWGVPYEQGGHTEERILAASEVVKSPGIPETAPIVRRIREAGIPVISEMEFAGRYIGRARCICITGSNGKTTTTSLIYKIMRDAGLNVALGGNIGESFAYSVATGDYDWYVLELSSFQLDGMYRFRAHIGGADEHHARPPGPLRPLLSELCGLEDAHRAEHDLARLVRLFGRRRGDLAAVAALRPAHETTALRREERRGERRGRRLPLRRTLHGRGRKSSVEIDTAKLRIKGLHNAYNAMAAALATLAAGVAPARIRRSLYEFAPVEHRLEPVAEKGGVLWINDSKATNVDSVYYALESMKRPVVWIAGGTDKGNDYGPLKAFAREKVHTLVCMGLDNAKAPERICGGGSRGDSDLFARRGDDGGEGRGPGGRRGAAVARLRELDLFRNYEDRGERFKRWVNENA